MPTTIHDLPSEVLHLILSQLSQVEDAGALLAASLVARHWRAPAQTSLWETRSLELDEYDVDTSIAAMELLAAMVGLRSLTVSTLDRGVTSVGSLEDESWIFRGYLQGLKSLHLSIEFVHKARGPIIPAFALSYFFLGSSVNSPRVVESILTASASTLTTLHLDFLSEASYEALIKTLPLLGNTLKSLTFQTETGCNLPAAGFSTLIPALSSLKALEELYLTADETDTAVMAVESLPSPVPVLELTYEGDVGSDSLAAAELLARIGGTAWSGLRRLRLGPVFSRKLLETEKGRELSRVCAERGIVVD
ncbi:hypothetical protein RQP46_000043 [Phenoliferia psychrophenolica]